ncbi:MAG: hypothetical protein AAF849_01185 [Bacteroidota bacterium]
MGYSNYKNLRQVAEKFNIRIIKSDLIPAINPIAPSSWLKTSLELAYNVVLTNEKVKSERLISPVLTEIHHRHKDQFALFSGEELNVEPENDLNGPCDFFFSARPDAYLLEAPIVAFTEAKDEDLDYGVAQCAAQMIGAQRFNAKAKENINAIWGCSTTAGEWKFLKLIDQTLYVDINSYYIDRVEKLLGVFTYIFAQYEQVDQLVASPN